MRTAAVALVLLVVVASGCGGGRSYSAKPTLACLAQLKLDGLPVRIGDENPTMLVAGGYQFAIVVGFDEGVSRAYADILHSGSEAAALVHTYKEKAATGEMGYSPDADVSHHGNVAFLWDDGFSPAWKGAVERCLR